MEPQLNPLEARIRENNARVLAETGIDFPWLGGSGNPPPDGSQAPGGAVAPSAGLGLPTRSSGDFASDYDDAKLGRQAELLLAQQSGVTRCSECGHSQTRRNKVCANCGRKLGENLAQPQRRSELLLSKLGSKRRNELPDSAFAIPSERKYPIHDISHARNALARASGKPEEETVKRAVYERYPELRPDEDKNLSQERLASFYSRLDLAEKRDDGLVWKALCKTGELALSPGPGQTDLDEPLVLSTELFEHLHQSVEERAFPYVTVPTTHANGLLENTGYVEKTEIVDSPDPNDPPGTKLLMGGIRFTDPVVHEKVLNGSIPDTSIGVKFNYRNKRTGKLYPAALEHVALTHQPWVDGLPAFGALSQERTRLEPVPEAEKPAYAGVYMSAETAAEFGRPEAEPVSESGDILSRSRSVGGMFSRTFSNEKPRRQMKHTRRPARRTEAPNKPEAPRTVEQLLASQQVQIEQAEARARAAEERAEAAEAAASDTAQVIHLSQVRNKVSELQSKGYPPKLVATVRDILLAAGPEPEEVTEDNATLSLSVARPAEQEGDSPTVETKHLSVTGIVDMLLSAVPAFGQDPSVIDVKAQLDELHASQEPGKQEESAKEKADKIYDELKRRTVGTGVAVN